MKYITNISPVNYINHYNLTTNLQPRENIIIRSPLRREAQARKRFLSRLHAQTALYHGQFQLSAAPVDASPEPKPLHLRQSSSQPPLRQSTQKICINQP